MNKKQAHAQGYRFSGSFGYNKEEIKGKAHEYSEMGYKAIVVNEPPNPLSRGYRGMGYSVFVEEKYFDDRLADENRALIACAPQRIEDLKKRLQEEIDGLEKRKSEAVEWLKRHGYEE